MLIGDKGESGGRRWEVYGFGLGPFSYSPKVSRWVWSRFAMGTFLDPSGQTLGGGKFCYRSIFYQSQGQSLGYAICPWDILHKVTPLEPHKEPTMFNLRILSLDHPY